ncbi:hypothetical protein G6F31_016153 [Rhizopus arrhizus]|nr:hypothetical protein G6F31_016153 [Rhizopus arrhizus]
MVAPPAKATSRFQLDAVDGPDGIAVAKSPGRMPPGLVTPTPASADCCEGMPRRGTAGTKPAEPTAPSGSGPPSLPSPK